MHGELSDKLQIAQSHLQLLSALTVVFVAEGGVLLTNVHNSMIGDRYFAGVST
jgi:hypothetical protein